MIFILLQNRKVPTVVGAGDLGVSGIRRDERWDVVRYDNTTAKNWVMSCVNFSMYIYKYVAVWDGNKRRRIARLNRALLSVLFIFKWIRISRHSSDNGGFMYRHQPSPFQVDKCSWLECSQRYYG